MTESPAAQSFAKAEATSPPFDSARLDALLDEAGMDAAVISSKHNIQYLFGGYRFFFFDHFDAIGVSRYLPLLLYVKGRPEQSTYIGHAMESYEKDLGKFWTPAFQTARASLDSAQLAIDHLRKLGVKRVGLERAFLPADAAELMARELPGVAFVEAHLPFERLRARKTREELDLLRLASELVVDSMLAVIASHGPGATKAEVVEALRREEVNRGLTFEYCLITAGTSLNRAPSEQVWGAGDIMSIDSGGNYKGYIGDLCRMAIQGEPDSELEDLLGEVDAIQMAARKPIRHGANGGEIYASAGEVLKRSSRANSIEFVAHGMGLISHEAPRLTSHGPVPYPAYDSDRPLESRHGHFDRDDDRPSPPRLHQARGHGRGHRSGLGGLWRSRAGLESRRRPRVVALGRGEEHRLSSPVASRW